MELQTEALAEVGHDINLFTRETDSLSTSHGYSLASAMRVMTGVDIGGGDLPEPDNASHALILHNLFPNFGTNWIRNWPGPVITVLHNYRYVCANGLLLRDSAPCRLCLTGSSWSAIRHACYRDSVVATIPLAIGNRSPVSRVTPLSRADAVVAQSERSRELFRSMGIGDDTLHYIPGFTATCSPRRNEPGKRWVFVGRLTPEKGLEELIRDWPEDELLDVIGTGEDESRMKALAGDNVTFLGSLVHDEVLHSLPNYRGLIFPGVCWEGAHPMVVREALSLSVPVIAAEGSSAADLIAVHGGGVVYRRASKTSLLRAIQEVDQMGISLRFRARSTALKMFSKKVWQDRMTEVLDSALVRRSA